MFVLGLDIGYSNLKIAMGHKDEGMTTKVLPAGAGRVELMPRNMSAGMGNDFLQVVINGEKWAAGVEPSRLQGWERELHRDYKSTDVYKALFYAALLVSEQTEIDMLVTGLPVDQAKDEQQRNELIDLLKGAHQITPKLEVTVKDVLVVPQPAGAYMDVVNSTDDDSLLEAIQFGTSVVCDPGFFSYDFTKLVEGEIHYHSSGTSLKAMSRLLQVADELILDDYGGSPGVEGLERAIRTGKPPMVFARRIELDEYLAKAGKTVTREAVTSMRKAMREDGMNADIVILAGGGASDYAEAAKELFPRSRIIEPKSPVLANARGFWHCG
ncbi:MAG: ParM/StbA family protein [Pseudomonadota bacterium]|nr:ParM/StbA family protein [Pseudomonadota bacterium]